MVPYSGILIMLKFYVLGEENMFLYPFEQIPDQGNAQGTNLFLRLIGLKL